MAATELGLLPAGGNPDAEEAGRAEGATGTNTGGEASGKGAAATVRTAGGAAEADGVACGRDVRRGEATGV